MSIKQHAGASYQLWNTYTYKNVLKAVVAWVGEFAYGADFSGLIGGPDSIRHAGWRDHGPNMSGDLSM